MPAVWCKSDQWEVTAKVSSRASQEAAQRKPDLVLRSKQSGASLLSCHSGAIQSEEVLGYDTTIEADSWPMDAKRSSVGLKF